jgi:hypothetical protein
MKPIARIFWIVVDNAWPMSRMGISSSGRPILNFDENLRFVMVCEWTPMQFGISNARILSLVVLRAVKNPINHHDPPGRNLKRHENSSDSNGQRVSIPKLMSMNEKPTEIATNKGECSRKSVHDGFLHLEKPWQKLMTQWCLYLPTRSGTRFKIPEADCDRFYLNSEMIRRHERLSW